MTFADDEGKAGTLGEKASDALDTAKDKVEDAWDIVTDKAEDLLETVKEKTSGIVDSVKERFESGSEPVEPVEPVEDFAAAGTAPPEDATGRPATVDEEASELRRHNQPEQL